MSDLPGDWKRATYRAPLHFLLSVPVAAASLAVPQLGRVYVAWRSESEAKDQATGKDTPGKAQIDLYSQTILVHKVLGLWGKL